MIKVCYSETPHADGVRCRLSTSGHAGYAPKGQDIVCAGASTLMQALVSLLASETGTEAAVQPAPDGVCMTVCAACPTPFVQGAFALAKAGFALLAERYPDNVSFADESEAGRLGMVDLQLFADGDGAQAAPALSRAQAQQAAAAGTLQTQLAAQPVQSTQQSAPQQAQPPVLCLPDSLPGDMRMAIKGLHARWAAEEAALRRIHPGFTLQSELQNPDMRRMMQMPGMHMQDAYRIAHYDETLRTTAQTVEQGVLERIRSRAARPAENGIRPGGAAIGRPDIAGMTRAEREALEQSVLHGAKVIL